MSSCKPMPCQPTTTTPTDLQKVGLDRQFDHRLQHKRRSSSCWMFLPCHLTTRGLEGSHCHWAVRLTYSRAATTHTTVSPGLVQPFNCSWINSDELNYCTNWSMPSCFSPQVRAVGKPGWCSLSAGPVNFPLMVRSDIDRNKIDQGSSLHIW